MIHVPTLEGMAYNFYGSSRLIVPMIDARNQQVFAGIYSFRKPETGLPDSCEAHPEEKDPLCVLSKQEALHVTDLCEKLNSLAQETGKEVILLGDGAFAYREIIAENLKAPYRYAPAHLAWQRAGSVAVRAADLARQGKLETAAAHRPAYLRVSQAERVRAQKEG